MPYSIGFIVVIVSIQYYGALKRASSMHQVKWQEFELLDKTLIAPMTSIYRFKLRREDEVLDIPTGHSLACCFNVDGKDEVRFYTPISNQFDKGFFDILVKHYEHGVVTKNWLIFKLDKQFNLEDHLENYNMYQIWLKNWL